jgi:hypothetical protein
MKAQRGRIQVYDEFLFRGIRDLGEKLSGYERESLAAEAFLALERRKKKRKASEGRTR